MNRGWLTRYGLTPSACLRSTRVVSPDTASGVLRKRHSPMRSNGYESRRRGDASWVGNSNCRRGEK